jgi:hypothetical protein
VTQWEGDLREVLRYLRQQQRKCERAAGTLSRQIEAGHWEPERWSFDWEIRQATGLRVAVQKWKRWADAVEATLETEAFAATDRGEVEISPPGNLPC